MRRSSGVIVFLLVLLLTRITSAQTITFTAETTTGVESVTPVLTWDTQPLADNCDASGDWSGPRGGAGTETLDPIFTGATYNLTCVWTDDQVTLTWITPTENTDDTPLTDLAGYSFYYGQDQGGPYPQGIDLPNPTATSLVIRPLTPGMWYFVGTSLNSRDVESVFSNETSKLIGEDVAQASVGITVNPRPRPMSSLSAN